MRASNYPSTFTAGPIKMLIALMVSLTEWVTGWCAVSRNAPQLLLKQEALGDRIVVLLTGLSERNKAEPV